MMGTWCDDYHLNIAQRRLDAAQLEAIQRMLKRDPENEELKAEAARAKRCLDQA